MSAIRSETPTNPLARAATSVPAKQAEWTGLAARAIAAAALLLLGASESYDGLERFTTIVAVLVVLSAAPLQGRVKTVVTSAGAGLALFAGATLTHYPEGAICLGGGAAATLAALVAGYHAGRLRFSVAGGIAGAPIAAAVAVFVIAITER